MVWILSWPWVQASRQSHQWGEDAIDPLYSSSRGNASGLGTAMEAGNGGNDERSAIGGEYPHSRK
jgi:hypothetical protein